MMYALLGIVKVAKLPFLAQDSQNIQLQQMFILTVTMSAQEFASQIPKFCTSIYSRAVQFEPETSKMNRMEKAVPFFYSWRWTSVCNFWVLSFTASLHSDVNIPLFKILVSLGLDYLQPGNLAIAGLPFPRMMKAWVNHVKKLCMGIDWLHICVNVLVTLR